MKSCFSPRLLQLCWLLLLSGLLPTPLAVASARAEVRYEWRDAFSQPERQKLTRWIDESVAALEQLVGAMPFDVHIILHRKEGAREPVPWANTERSRIQGVHFHVDPRFPFEAFREDWTAPHELSHLVLPYVGSKNSWFAEGFASFMQYQVMHEAGVLDGNAMVRRYQQRLDAAARKYSYDDRPFARAAPRLRAEGKYPTMYWGGAAYFLQVDDQLHTAGSGLIPLLRSYLACCRRNRASLDDLVGQLDRLAGAVVFTPRLEAFRTEAGFPQYRNLTFGN